MPKASRKTPQNDQSNVASFQLERALALIKQGLPVFPCKPLSFAPKDKRPYTKHGFKDATDDEAQVRQWWKRWPEALVGMPTGSPSGISALDLDNPQALALLPAAIVQVLERAYSYPTRRPGGRHYLFLDPEGRACCNQGTVGPGIDMRGTGGYVIVWGTLVKSEVQAVPPEFIDFCNGGRAAPVTAALPVYADSIDPAYGKAEWERIREDAARTLAGIDPDRDDDGNSVYGRWSECGMALHHTTGGYPDALQAWIDWSASGTGGKFKPGECEKKWDGFARGALAPALTWAGWKRKYLNGGALKQEEDDPLPELLPQDFWSAPPPALYPAGALSPQHEAFVLATSACYGAVPLAYAAASLAVFASAIPGTCRIAARANDPDPARGQSATICVKLVGESGMGKTPTNETCMAPAARLQRELVTEFQIAMTAWKSMPKKERGPQPHLLHAIARNFTYPKLAVMKAVNGERGILAYSDEWSSLLARTAGSKGEASPAGTHEDMMQFWNGQPYDRHRIGDGSSEAINDLHIPYWGGADLGAVTPVKLRADILRDAATDGLFARQDMVLLTPKSRLPRDDAPLDPEHARSYERAYRRLWGLGEREGALLYTLAPADEPKLALLVAEKLELADLERAATPGFAYWLEKYEMHLRRTALALHLIEWAYGVADAPERVVRSTCFAGAAALISAIEQNTMVVHQHVLGGGDPHALVRQIAEVTLVLHARGKLEEGNTIVSRQLLSQNLDAFKKAGDPERDRSLRAFIESGWVSEECTIRQRRGRRMEAGTRWRVTPAAFTRYAARVGGLLAERAERRAALLARVGKPA